MLAPWLNSIWEIVVGSGGWGNPPPFFFAGGIMKRTIKKLMAHFPNALDATSFYRGAGVLDELQERMDFVIMDSDSGKNPDVNWRTLQQCDAVFMQRPCADNHIQILKMARNHNKKVWVDYDDDLFSVPRSNRTYKMYGNPEIQNNVATFLMYADIVTVSTEALKRKFLEVIQGISKEEKVDESRIIVIPNAYNAKFSGFMRDKNEQKQNKIITWRGSDTHDKDLMSVLPAFKKVFAKHLDWSINFFGAPFWHFVEELETIEGIQERNIVEVSTVDPNIYWKAIYDIAPSLFIVPLWDCEFNRAKSNIAWIEGLHAGAVTLAPDWEEWRRPGVINYKDEQDFAYKLNMFLSGAYDVKQLHKDGWDYLNENLLLEDVNRKREEVLRGLFGG